MKLKITDCLLCNSRLLKLQHINEDRFGCRDCKYSEPFKILKNTPFIYFSVNASDNVAGTLVVIKDTVYYCHFGGNKFDIMIMDSHLDFITIMSIDYDASTLDIDENFVNYTTQLAEKCLKLKLFI